MRQRRAYGTRTSPRMNFAAPPPRNFIFAPAVLCNSSANCKLKFPAHTCHLFSFSLSSAEPITSKNKANGATAERFSLYLSFLLPGCTLLLTLSFPDAFSNFSSILFPPYFFLFQLLLLRTLALISRALSAF